MIKVKKMEIFFEFRKKYNKKRIFCKIFIRDSKLINNFKKIMDELELL